MSRVYQLVVSTHLKNMLVKMGSSSPGKGENKKCLKPPGSILLYTSVPEYLLRFVPFTNINPSALQLLTSYPSGGARLARATCGQLLGFKGSPTVKI